jgi:hypothetical protein
MRRELFKGLEVIQTGPGQWHDCTRHVIRVLVDENGHRQWYAAEIGHYGYVPHNCKPAGDEPLKKAA